MRNVFNLKFFGFFCGFVLMIFAAIFFFSGRINAQTARTDHEVSLWSQVAHVVESDVTNREAIGASAESNVIHEIAWNHNGWIKHEHNDGLIETSRKWDDLSSITSKKWSGYGQRSQNVWRPESKRTV